MSPFDPAALNLPDPVLRHLTHALAPGAELGRPTRLEMTGRLKVGIWLPYRATWIGDGRSFLWRARAGITPLKAIHATDRFDDTTGTGEMDVRLAGRLPLVHADGPDTARSAAARAAGEAALWATGALIGDHATWEALAQDHLTVTTDLGVERPTVHLHTYPRTGAIRASHFTRWDARTKDPHPTAFGCDVHETATFGPLTLPSRITAGWDYGTPDYAPFFEATIVAATYS